MDIQLCTGADFDQILSSIDKFWGDSRTLHLHHPMFLYEFGNSAYVIRENEKIVAYLFGFISQTGPVGYIHLVAVHEDYRHKGLGGKLYQHFGDFAKTHDCIRLKALVNPANQASFAFHQALGFHPAGDPEPASYPVTRDYGGPGIHRIVMEKVI